jgi:ketosteroid isomerase-like protein
MNRLEVEQLLGRLYAARTEGRLDPLCALFAPNAHFRIVGSSDGKPIAIAAQGTAEIRTWLSVMLKTFKLTHYQLISLLVEGTKASVHWRVDIHSKITGIVVPTELVDLVELGDDRILAYREFFAPC